MRSVKGTVAYHQLFMLARISSSLRFIKFFLCIYILIIDTEKAAAAILGTFACFWLFGGVSVDSPDCPLNDDE